MELIENTQFGLQCKSKEKDFKTRLEYLDWYEKSRNNYDVFLNQPLKLEMFVPCDHEGNVLKEPEFKDTLNSNSHFLATEKYQKAKEKVLFEGFSLSFETSGIICISSESYEIQIAFYKNGVITINSKEFKTIEDIIKYNITLTSNAEKLIK